MSLTPNNNKSLLNLFELTVEEITKALNCIKIGEVQSFDPSKQTVSVKILHKKTNETNIDVREIEDYSVLPEVPVVIMGGGTSYISFPIQKGDNCLLLFNDFELDGWWVSGEALPSDFPRRHDLSDAIAIVGLNSLTTLIKDYSDVLKINYADYSNIEVGEDIKINNGSINLNGSVRVSENLSTVGELSAGNGASGIVYTGSQTLSFSNGILVSIE